MYKGPQESSNDREKDAEIIANDWNQYQSGHNKGADGPKPRVTSSGVAFFQISAYELNIG